MNVAKSLACTLTDNGIKTELLANFEKTKCQGIHIHCPDGSVSKDGPSAGTAITTALFSLFNNKKIKRNIAITGEINLQGKVTAIGGLEQKIFGGVRAGVTTFLYPESNKIDYEKVREKYKDKPFLDNIEFISISNIMDVFAHVFE
jgi:ATP-dependent Lon protease